MMDAVQSAIGAGFSLKIIPVQPNGNFMAMGAVLPMGGLGTIGQAKPVILQYNPQSFSIKEEIDFTEAQPQGDAAGHPAQYKGIKPRNFSIEFTIDGTGLFSDINLPVNLHIALFRSLTTVPNTDAHEPNKLIVQYGTFVCACNLISSETTYTLFDRQGLPLRAKIRADFKEVANSELNKATRFFSSPDVTHQMVIDSINEHKNFSYLVYEKYKTPDYYIATAKANGLKQFRRLKHGEFLFFPPIK
jgi:hypothetical protein